MFKFTINYREIKDIHTMFTEGKLVVDNSYQRRSVWGEKDKVRLIETILLNLVIPELFFWKAKTDPETGESITHIVDGQQRINAIIDFLNNEFKLKANYLLEKESKERFENKNFKDLSSQEKEEFWSYRLTIVEIDPKATKIDIINMFRRLNLTDYNLNDQEKRNSISGEFAALARELADLDFWEKYNLFRLPDVRRMKDVEFCGSIILLSRRGIIDQTDQTALNDAYEDLKVCYNDADKDRETIIKAIDIVERFISDESKKFVQRKAQLYSLFSLAFYIIRNGIEINENIINQFNSFVMLYGIFDNEIDISEKLTENEKTLFDYLKKYKLASSEGLNKHSNRMIRTQVLKTFCFNLTNEQKEAQFSLREKILEYRNRVKIIEEIVKEDD